MSAVTMSHTPLVIGTSGGICCPPRSDAAPSVAAGRRPDPQAAVVAAASTAHRISARTLARREALGQVSHEERVDEHAPAADPEEEGAVDRGVQIALVTISPFLPPE